MTRVHRWAAAALPETLRWQAASFIRVAWPDIDGGLVYEPYPSSVNPTYYAVVHGDDLLMSMAATFDSPVVAAGRTWTATLLGNVFTFPASRRRGLGRAVVAAATEDIVSSAVDIGALLCDDSLHAFYGEHGWRAVPDSATITVRGERLPGSRMMILASTRAEAAHADLRSSPLHVPSAW